MARIPAANVLPIAILSLAAFVGCNHFDSGPSRTEMLSVALDESESVSAELRMGAGELTVRGGSPKLMDGEFTFGPEDMRPEIRYDPGGSKGRLRIEEPSGTRFNRGDYRWNLKLNDDKPIDLQVNLGAGEGDLQLGSLNLRSLEVQMGAGELRLDLRGTPARDYSVNVRGGVGEATVYLPRDVGIVADVKGGIGEIDAGGLESRDGHYVNKAYGVSKTTVRLDIRGGVGSIRLVTE
jgi:hypothetical protein